MTTKEKLEPDSLLPLNPSVFHILLRYRMATCTVTASCRKLRNIPKARSSWDRELCTVLSSDCWAKRLIVEVDERPDPELDDERRRYYRLTDFGQKVLKAEVRRLSKMLAVAQSKRLIPKRRS
jgi:hypothetical protein